MEPRCEHCGTTENVEPVYWHSATESWTTFLCDKCDAEESAAIEELDDGK